MQASVMSSGSKDAPIGELRATMPQHAGTGWREGAQGSSSSGQGVRQQDKCTSSFSAPTWARMGLRWGSASPDVALVDGAQTRPAAGASPAVGEALPRSRGLETD